MYYFGDILISSCEFSFLFNVISLLLKGIFLIFAVRGFLAMNSVFLALYTNFDLFFKENLLNCYSYTINLKYIVDCSIFTALHSHTTVDFNTL